MTTTTQGDGGMRDWQARARRHAAVLLPLLVVVVAMAAGLVWQHWRLDRAQRERDASQAARLDTLVALVAARQGEGAYAAAAALAASEPGLPRAYKDNAELARHETATLVDTARLPLGRALDVDWLQAAGGTQPVLLSWGWTSGVSTLELGTRTSIVGCGLMPGAPRLRIAPDGRWFSLLNLAAHEAALRPIPGCAQPGEPLADWSDYLARQEGRGAHVTALLPLAGPRLLVGWADGRVEMLRPGANPLPLMRFDSAATGLLANTGATQYALLSRSGQMALVDAKGRAVAPPLALRRDVLATTRDEGWTGFLRDADLPSTHALVIDEGASQGRGDAVLGIVTTPQSAGVYLHDLAADGPALHDAAVEIAPNDDCPSLVLLGATRLVSLPMETRCGGAAQSLALPGDWRDSDDVARGYAAAAFCEGGATMVLGTRRGALLWLRRVPGTAGAPARIDVEHREQSAWDDPVGALACREDGSVHAGFRSAGIKAYRPRLHLQQKRVGVRSIRDFAEVLNEDRAWPIETWRGAARVEFHAEAGTLSLLRAGTTVWRRRIADPAPPRPGPADQLNAVVLDVLRDRVWTLTTMGRLSLLDLNSGALLTRFSTSYFAATPSKDVALEQPKLDAGGQLSFVHRRRDYAMRVVVDEGSR